MPKDYEMYSWSLRPSAPAYARATLRALGLFRTGGSATTASFASDDVFRLNPLERAVKRRVHARGWCGPLPGPEGEPLAPTWTSDM
jgi:hypothetical protein